MSKKCHENGKFDKEDSPLINCFCFTKNADGYFRGSTTYHKLVWFIFNYEDIISSP